MAEAAIPQQQPYEIHGTAPAVTHQSSDIALTGLFNAHMALINSERQAIWQRFTAMLIGNSIILNFLAAGPSPGRPWYEVIIGAWFGIVLCVCWWRLSKAGWKYIGTLQATANRLQWDKNAPWLNPFHQLFEWEKSRREPIYFWTRIAIAIFMLLYVLIIIKAVARK
jgi:hypothetical protein